MKNILKLVGNLVSPKTGLLSVIAEKGIGKISFKRVGATMVIAWIVNSVNPVDMSWIHAFIIVGCLTAVALPKILSKDFE